MTKTLSKSERLNILLRNGYFPTELPPPFQTKDFARFRASLQKSWPTTETAKKSIPEMFSAPRVGFKRRHLTVVNPISQFQLSKLIADNWIEIWSFLEKSRVSLDKPRLTGGVERAIPKPDFSRIELKKLETSAEFDHILYSDISRFYGTIYTHTLPWALYGKTWSKSNMFSGHFKASLGNQLDVLVRRGQDNQTIGIPIGPDTSRILSEIIAVAIENKFAELSGHDLDGAFRYVDDWFIGYNTAVQSEEAISHLARASGEFELELNIEKTRIVNSSSQTFSNWPNELSAIDMRYTTPSTQARKLRYFFGKAFHFFDQNPTENVLEFALKTSRSFTVVGANYLLFESFVLRCARASKITLPIVCQILINYQGQGASISLDRCKKLILDTIKTAFPLGHSSEVAWSLFLAKELKIALPAEALADMCNTDDSICALLCLDLEEAGLVVGHLNKDYWSSLMTTRSLWDSNWLLAYEADLKGWLNTKSLPGHVEGDDWFRPLKAKKISFYDKDRTVPTFKQSSILQRTIWKRRSVFEKLLFGAGIGSYTGPFTD